MKTVAHLAAAGIAAATVMLSSPVTASAAGSMQWVGGSGCRSAGNHTFQCFDYFTGGTAPYTLTGSTSNTYATISQMSLSATGSSYEIWVRGYCDYGKSTTVYITVRDSSGRTLALTRPISCYAGSEV